MIDRRHIELMNAAIDGLCSEEELEELERYLQSDLDARRHYEELREVGRVLAAAPDATPPPQLHGSIMRAVAGKSTAARGKPRRPGWAAAVSSVRGWVSPAPRVRYAFAFAAGLVLGIALFTVLAVTVPSMAPDERSLLYGALGISCDRCSTWSSRVAFDVAGASGEARVRYCAENVLVELEVMSQSEVTVVVSFDEDASFEGFRVARAGDHSVRVAGNRAAITQTGDGSYELTFIDYTESRRPLVMTVVSGDLVLFEGALPPMRE